MDPKPFNTNYLPEQANHRVYYAQYGNPNGPAIISLHGGPGSKSKPKHVKGYDLDKYHVIIFDQRGCGESTPIGEIKSNTTQDLITDTERIRTELGIENWFISGVSWGAALALAYTQTYPERVIGMLLGSVFLARPRDVQWAFTNDNGIERLFPDLWEKRLEFLREYKATAANAAEILLKNIETGHQEAVNKIVAGVNNWEGNLMNAQEDLSFMNPEDVSDKDIAAVKVSLHYEANNFFMKPNQLLDDLPKVQNIPTVIVHGRYDVLCPPEQAWELQKQLSNSEIVFLPTSNHKLTADGDIAKRLAFNLFLEKQSN